MHSAPTDSLPTFGLIADRVRHHAQQRANSPALVDDVAVLSWRELDTMMDRVAASLQRDGLQAGDTIAICAASSVRYAAVFLAALRVGIVVAPLAPGSSAESLSQMLDNAGARLLFWDPVGMSSLGTVAPRNLAVVALNDDGAAGAPFGPWLAPSHALPHPVAPRPDWPLNIIYSSGTTGQPKGIVQGHGMRWAHVLRGARYGYGPDTVALLSTPLYSNTTLVVFFPAIAYGGCVVLMPKFGAAGYLALAERHRVTHTMLVPVQYRRLMAHPAFDAHDLASFQMKFSTSAPFAAALKADVLKRWPGGLVEFYGMTEGGGTCILEAHLHPDKLHTVGRPAEGSDIRLIDEAGGELAAGETGEVVGHSAGMMIGYHRRPEKTRDAEWFDATGKRFIRTGDIGRFDEDGFLTLIDRRKDMIISGGFNIYPSDLETVLLANPAVADAAVVGAPSDEWGETPVAFVVRHPGNATNDAALLAWANARVGKTQRLARLHCIEELPRSPIGKVLKRELREPVKPSTREPQA